MKIQDLDTFKIDQENFGKYGYYMLSEGGSAFFKSVKIPCIGFIGDPFAVFYYQGMDSNGNFRIVRRVLDHDGAPYTFSHEWESNGEDYVRFIYDCQHMEGFDEEAVFELLYQPITLDDDSGNYR